MSRIRVDYRGVMSHTVGAEHGLAAADLDTLGPRIKGIVELIERERAEGKRRYRALPDDEAMVRRVMETTARHRGGCENLVVLGIGGSALGNIALQTAL